MILDTNQDDLVNKLLKTMNTLALINSTKDVDILINLVLDSIKEVMGVEASSLAQVDPEKNELFFSQASGGSQKVKDIRLKMGEGVAGHVAVTKKAMVINDIEHNRYHYKRARHTTDFITRNMLCVPLVVREKVIGVMQALNKLEETAFDQMDFQIFTTFANQVAVALENARLYKLAVYDGLTDIFDRRYFDAWITQEYARVKRYGTNLSFIIFDIDHFKNVNDTFGHQAGDFVLKKIARKIKAHIREADLFARYGGEEFVIVLPETNLKYAHLTAERYRRFIEKESFIYQGREIPVTISAGVACYQETPLKTALEFIDLADKMLYLAKKNGRNQIRVSLADGRSLDGQDQV